MIALAVTVDVTYTWSQALADLSQIAPIVALTVFMLFAIVVDLALPKSRRGDAVAMVAAVGYVLSLATSAYRWTYGNGGPAYRGYATGDKFALFFEVLFAVLGILTLAVSHSYLKRAGASSRASSTFSSWPRSSG